MLPFRSLLIVTLLQGLFADTVSAAAEKDHPEPLFSTERTFSTRFIVPMVLKGKTYDFVFDTGSTWMVIDPKYAPILGTKPTRKELRKLADTGLEIDDDGSLIADLIVGQMRIQTITPKALSFGALRTTRGLPGAVADLSVVSKKNKIEFAGTFGLSEIKRFTWVIENGRKLSAYDPRAFADQAVRDRCAKMTRGKSSFEVPVSVGLTEFSAELDSGGREVRLTKEQIADLKAKKLYKKTGTETYTGIDGVVSTREHGKLTQLKIGSVTVTDVAVEEADGTAIGPYLLSGFQRVVMDFQNERICFDG